MNFLRSLIFEVIVRPFILFVLGLKVKNFEKLPKQGPMILVSNHNSHLDTPVLMALFDRKNINRVHPVAAADYFLRNRIAKFIFLKIVQIIPIERCGDIRNETPGNKDPLAAISNALSAGDIIIFFPEGTRGKPEEIAPFKKGIARLAELHPDVPVVPVFVSGLGKSLPKGDFIFVPFVCDIVIGDPILFSKISDREKFLSQVEHSVHDLSTQVKVASWT